MAGTGVCQEGLNMKLMISFSGRKGGNCDSIARFLAGREDEVIFFRDKKIHACCCCEYECFNDKCKFREDDIYDIYHKMTEYEKIVLIVPMYCGNPSSLYFIFNERGQDYFMHHGEQYEEIISRLYIVGVYGKQESAPDFIPCFEKWFEGSSYKNRVLGIERHRYDLKMEEAVLDVEEVRRQLKVLL